MLYLFHRGGKLANNITMFDASDVVYSSIRPTGYRDVDFIDSLSTVEYRFWLRTNFDVLVKTVAFIGKANKWQRVDERMVELL